MSIRESSAVDVLIPVFNGADTIESALSSIQCQTLQHIRIIVVDDGSTDDTNSIISRIAARDPRIQVVKQPNLGIVDALNAGLRLCTAEFVARHDADDIAFPSRLETQLAYLRQYSDCTAVGCNVRYIDHAGAWTGMSSNFDGDVEPDAFTAPSREPYLLHPFLMVRRKAVESVGGYRHSFHSEDTDLYWRLLGVGRLHNLPEILGEYRRHDKSVSAASILNGRIAAVCSQLAALSYRRIQGGRPDLTFDQSALNCYKDASSIENMIHIASAQLDSHEIAYLEIATAAKLLLAFTFRPYTPEKDDYHFIRRALHERQNLISAANQRTLLRLQLSVAARLARRRRFGEMFDVLPSAIDIVRFGWRALNEVAARLPTAKSQAA